MYVTRRDFVIISLIKGTKKLFTHLCKNDVRFLGYFEKVLLSSLESKQTQWMRIEMFDCYVSKKTLTFQKSSALFLSLFVTVQRFLYKNKNVWFLLRIKIKLRGK